ncbi:MAG: ABC transporter permease [Alphaproteobacteria bacterium]
MSLLDTKLARELVSMRGQVLTIALVAAAGVAVFVAAISTFYSLEAAQSRFYDRSRFPDIFVTVKRAPLSIVPRLEAIPGVATIEPRIVKEVIVDWPGSRLPVSARMISLSEKHGALSRLHLRRGSAPAPGSSNEIAIGEAFAEANNVGLGSTLRAILNGRLEDFRITGIGLSPEYVQTLRPGLFIPDDRFFAVAWIDREAAEGAFDMEGAFNDAVIRLAPGADASRVIEDLDRLLEPYGSVGAIERRDQPSHRFVEDELNQQKVMSITVPFIFFGVAAFLVNIALSRLVLAQREQIATLKALGYPTLPLGFHYFKLVVVIITIGSVLGVAGGYLFGHAMIMSYRGFFRFPALGFEITGWSVVAGIAISLAAASLGILTAVRSVVALKPAVAMRPEAPIKFRRGVLDFLALDGSPRAKMILRHVGGRPLQTALTTLGIAFAVPMVVLGLFWRDSVDYMMDVQFNLIERGNAVVTFPQPVDANIIRDLKRERGIMKVEGQRYVPVRMRAGQRIYLTSIIGLHEGGELRVPRDLDLRPIEPAPDGITLSKRLAKRLDVVLGDEITIEVMEGKRRKVDVPVASIVEEMLGMSSYMEIGALNKLTGEGDVVSAAALYIEPSAIGPVSERFKSLPVIESASMKAYSIAMFFDKLADLVLVSGAILTGFAIIIAVGVVYNSARIRYQERARELASLRVLGFTQAEVSRLLFTEFMIVIAIGIPIGLVLSQYVVDLIAHFHSNESFQVPSVIEPRTFAAAALIVLLTGLASTHILRRQVYALDLVAVLKTSE